MNTGTEYLSHVCGTIYRSQLFIEICNLCINDHFQSQGMLFILYKMVSSPSFQPLNSAVPDYPFAGWLLPITKTNFTMKLFRLFSEFNEVIPCPWRQWSNRALRFQEISDVISAYEERRVVRGIQHADDGVVLLTVQWAFHLMK